MRFARAVHLLFLGRRLPAGYFFKVSRLNMKKYWIIVYFLAGLAQLAVWKDKVVSEIGVGPSIAVAAGYLLVLGMLGFLAARGVEATRTLALQKQNRLAKSREQENGQNR